MSGLIGGAPGKPRWLDRELGDGIESSGGFREWRLKPEREGKWLLFKMDGGKPVFAGSAKGRVGAMALATVMDACEAIGADLPRIDAMDQVRMIGVEGGYVIDQRTGPNRTALHPIRKGQLWGEIAAEARWSDEGAKGGRGVAASRMEALWAMLALIEARRIAGIGPMDAMGSGSAHSEMACLAAALRAAAMAGRMEIASMVPSRAPSAA